jgi:hypothetical protein
MADALVAVARMDPQDDANRAATLSLVHEMLAFCHGHLKHEEAFVHSAMEARAPGSSRQSAEEHGHHQLWLDHLEADLAAVVRAAVGARETAVAALYGRFALFVGENF